MKIGAGYNVQLLGITRKMINSVCVLGGGQIKLRLTDKLIISNYLEVKVNFK